jgi:hypothetical protein
MTHRWDRVPTKWVVGNLIRLRSRTWFLDRPKEIPLRLVRHWKELTDQHGALPLETYLEMANSFTDLQMENLGSVGEDVALPQTVRLFEISRMRYALRLYAALSPDQKQALWGGKSVPLAQMTPAQRELFLASLEERSRHEPWPMNIERGTEARLSLEAVPRIVAIERRAVSAARQDQASSASRPGRTPARPAASATPGSVPAGSQPDGVTRYPVTRLTLQFAYAPDQEDDITLTVASPR